MLVEDDSPAQNVIIVSSDNRSRNHDDNFGMFNLAKLPVSPKLTQTLPLQVSEKPKNTAKTRWKKVFNVIKAVNMMQKPPVNHLNTISDVLSDLSDRPQLKRAKSARVLCDELDNARYSETFFELAARGGPRQVKGLARLLELDKRKHLYDKIDDNHLLNRKNMLGQSPLYIAAQHGNI